MLVLCGIAHGEEVVWISPLRCRVMRLIFMLQTRYEGKRCVAGDTDANGPATGVTLLKWKGEVMSEKNRCIIPMKLQLFAGGGNGGGGTAGAGGQGQQVATQQQTQQQTQPAVDYTKIQQMLDGMLAAKEDTALKAYFKQQGLSQQEVEQAISAFKQQKAANTPDVGAIQTQMAELQRATVQANTEKEAMFLAGEIGVELKTMPYVLKLADLTGVADEKGNISKEALKTALNKVLEELPQLKPAVQNQQSGFRQIGAGGQQDTPNVDDQLAAIFGNKK